MDHVVRMDNETGTMKQRLGKSFAVFSVLLLAGAGVLLRADNNPRTPISRESILRAMDSSGMKIAPDQLEPLSDVTAAERNPQLRVVRVEVLDGESDRALLQCEHHNVCLPFYVVVHRDAFTDGRETKPARRALPPEALLVRGGKAAVLVIEGDYIRMTMPVLCLQSGGLGQRVRVLSKDTKKTFLARVTGPGVVTSVASD
jgi:hypothetical protein